MIVQTNVVLQIEEYKRCPFCKKRLSMKLIGQRIQRKLVKCPKCARLIPSEIKVNMNGNYL